MEVFGCQTDRPIDLLTVRLLDFQTGIPSDCQIVKGHAVNCQSIKLSSFGMQDLTVCPAPTPFLKSLTYELTIALQRTISLDIITLVGKVGVLT